MASSSPGSRPGFAPQLLALAEKHGSPEERRMVERAADDLSRFFAHPDTQRLGRHGALDIGLENRLVLKFNLMGIARASPWALVDDWACRMPALQEAADAILRYRLRCHAGIKLTPDGVEYEIYPYETPDHLLGERIFARHRPSRAGLPAPPHCFGCASDGSLSAYAELHGVDYSELELALGFRLPAEGLKSNALFNSRLAADGNWHTDKAGIEFLPFPSHLLNCVLTNFNLHFAFLVHRGGSRRYGVIGVYGSRNVLYTPLLPTIQP